MNERSDTPSALLVALVTACLLLPHETLALSLNTTTNEEQLTANGGQAASLSQHPYCTLGEDTFQIGEQWNPNLPPFGVQVCVLCECTIRQRKSCYEAKVTCRRITNECQIIDSCPDGKRPATVAGQCCKSCQAQQPQQDVKQQSIGQSLAYEHDPSSSSPSSSSQRQLQATISQQTLTPPDPMTAFKIVYMNERTKEYLSMIKSLPVCQNKDGDKQTIVQPASNTVSAKTSKGSKNDLNGIDTRLAFKSLHDAAPNYLNPARNRPESTSRDYQETSAFMIANSKRVEHTDDSLRHDHQHPNDVQSVASGANSINSNVQNQANLNLKQSHQHSINQQTNLNNIRESVRQQPALPPALPQPNTCLLGNEIFQIGDVWNPVLPPFGVQVCVQCNCIFRVRKACYETRVTCRRINKDCPSIDLCPDGKPPVAVSGQCCKSCPQNVEQQTMEMLISGTNSSSASSQTITPIPFDVMQKNEKVFREFQTISKTLPACVKKDGLDIHNSNRYTNAQTTKRTQASRK